MRSGHKCYIADVLYNSAIHDLLCYTGWTETHRLDRNLCLHHKAQFSMQQQDMKSVNNRLVRRKDSEWVGYGILVQFQVSPQKAFLAKMEGLVWHNHTSLYSMRSTPSSLFCSKSALRNGKSPESDFLLHKYLLYHQEVIHFV